MKQLNIRKHVMTAISYLIPFVSAAGMLMVIGNILGGKVVEIDGGFINLNDALSTLGANGLGFIPIVISTGIAYSIADKAGIAPGIILGVLCKTNGYGFLGGIVVGFLAGYLTKIVLSNLKLPKWMQGLMPQLIQPLIVSLIIAILMQYIIGVPIIWLTESVNSLLKNLSSKPEYSMIFGIVVGVLSAVDYGGPINKVVFTFSAAALSEGFGGPICNLIQASMIAPFGLTIGYFLSKIIGKKDLFSQQEVDSLKTAFIMGCFQITEGSFPIILNNLLRITICTAVGAGVSGGLVGLWNIESKVPSGGFVALPGINKPFLWLVSLLVGSLVFAILLQFLKNKKVTNFENKKDSNDELDNLSFS
ncbi:MAG: PTS fructose transporter subunit IIC [Anaerococcus vaginalis]|nr:PTS fructose transporter subunit IIC [Anaerococcus vaginalis]